MDALLFAFIDVVGDADADLFVLALGGVAVAGPWPRRERLETEALSSSMVSGVTLTWEKPLF